jgi:hypothetical protein
MPLVLKRNLQTQDDAFDNHVMSGELRVGRIYRRDIASRPELQFLWAINGVYGGPDGMRVSGITPTVDQAQAELQENWEKWLAWAGLQEISSPHQPPAELP